MTSRVRSLWLVGVLFLAGCGSNPATSTDRPGDTTTATTPVDDLPAIDRTAVPALTSNLLRLAVVDQSHALVLDQADGMLVSVALADGDGGLRPLDGPIPRMGKIDVVGTEDGFVIVGIRCPGSEPFNTQVAEDEQLCTSDPDAEVMVEAQVIAVALDATGKVEWTAVGPWIDPSRFGGATPTPTGALTWIDRRYFTVEDGRFEPVDPPPGSHGLFAPCVLRDGRLAAFVGTLNSQQDDALGGRRQLLVRMDGNWSAHSPAREIPQGQVVGGSCTVGGLVSDTDLFAGGPAIDANLADVSRESIAGITADDTLLTDHTPRGLVDPQSGEMVEPLPDARYVALSWDGRTIAQITDDEVRTQTTP